MILLAITVHEYMHARMALACGDPTAKQMGRITLNPLAHLDPIGAICLLFAPIGWGKPVPVNPFNLRSPKRDDVIISIGGPASNIAMAIVIGLAVRLVPWPWTTSYAVSEGVYRNFVMLFLMLRIGLFINIGLAVFNMLPLFPLDGSHVVKGFLSGPASIRFEEFSRYAPGILMGLILFEHVLKIPLLTGIIWPPIKFLANTLGGAGALMQPPSFESFELYRSILGLTQ